MVKDLPIDPRIITFLSKSTVKSIIDGVVELVTNSDDSYRRLEEMGIKVSGIIEIEVWRKKGGICEQLIVRDCAEGMNRSELERSIVFSGDTSGFTKGRSVRGLFGRGLKETIISLGEGIIETVRDRKKYQTRIWHEKGSAFYDEELLENEIDTNEANGTKIDIRLTSQKYKKVPELETFLKQLRNHYALRDILRSPDREVWLIFHDLKRKIKDKRRVIFKPPEGQKILEESSTLPVSKDRITMTIYESPESLDNPRNNPCALSGILIKTNSAILDNQLFKFEADPAAYYFFGEALCHDLEDRLRGGETEIINPNRTGLDWKHKYCEELEKVISSALEPLIARKRSELHRKPVRELDESQKKLIRKLCSKLNELAKFEIEDEVEVIDPEPELLSLSIRPQVVNVIIGKDRLLSIYAPLELVEAYGKIVLLECDGDGVDLEDTLVILEPYPKYKDIWHAYVKVYGTHIGTENKITGILGDEKAICIIKVKEELQAGKKKKRLAGRKGGFIRDILFDELVDPLQRVAYEEGIIKIFIDFPSNRQILGNQPRDSFETPEGKMLISELVGEGFCKELARKGIEIGKYPNPPGSEIDAYNAALNEIQKKYLHVIQEVIFQWKS